MSSPDTNKDQNAILVGAYRIAHQTTEVGKAEQAVDRVSENVTTKTQSPTFAFVNEFYTANQATIQQAAAGFASLDNKTIENAISTFTESAKVVMKGLDALGQVHPFIGVAVVAFKLVVTLDLTRRENNQKVLAIRVQMQDMMCVLFQLRKMKDPEEEGPDGISVKDRMQPLIERIANSIRECGSACDAYLKKSFLSRTLKCKIYESRLAGWATTFADFATELGRALAVHTALGVDAANEKLDKQTTTLKSIESTMLEIFKKIESPREREVAKFIDENGGARACIEKDDLLTKLISKTGESLSSVAQRSNAKGSDEVAGARKALLKDLAEDVDEVFKKNLAVFEAKMAIQRQQITEAIGQQGQQIMTVLLSGAHEKIRDADLQRLWKEMGWKGSVKARHFVLALRDYFTDQFNVVTYPMSPSVTATILPSTPPADANSPNDIEKSAAEVDLIERPVNSDDRWTLEHVNVAHLQPILEAIDDDGTGFISIKEANTFAVQRPKGWTLLHWLAFWAKGWYHSISKYKNQIYLLIQQMHRDLEAVKPDNRFIVDWYLDLDCFRTIDQLLRSTKTADENERLDPDLSKLTDAYVKGEEERLERNLESVGYNIDSPATVSLITGAGRIERHIYPLLYLLLRHHARVVKVACHHIIDLSELDHWAESLDSLVVIVKQRVETLGVIYKQIYADAKIQLENFAFGMYRLIWESPNSWKPVENSFAAWQDTSTERDESREDDYNPDDVRILRYPTQDTFSYRSIDSDLPPFQLDGDLPPYSSGIEGLWTGHCWHTDTDGDRVSVKGLLLVRISGAEGGSLTGRSESCCGTADVFANMEGDGGSPCKVLITLHDGLGSNELYQLSGIFDPVTQTIKGTYEVEGGDEDEEDEEEDEEEEGTEGTEGEGEGEGGEEGEKEEEGETEEEGYGGDGGDDETRTEEISEIGSERGVGENEDELQHAGEGVGSGDEAEEKEVEAEVEDQDQGEAPLDAGSDSDVEAVEDSQEYFTFALTRTPPELCRYRYSTEEFQQNAPRARWSFACKAVLHHVQKRRWTWPFLKNHMAERKNIVDLRLRDWNESDNLAPDMSLTTEESDALSKFDDSVSPTVSGFCRALVEYLNYREAYLFQYECYNCGRSILYPSYVCLQCISMDHSNKVTLCPDCVEEPSTDDGFMHDKTHSMLKTFIIIHDYRTAFLIRDARALVERIKNTLRDIEGGRQPPDSKSKGKTNRPRCACCNQPISLPCYVCAICARDTYICADCDSKSTPVLSNGPAPHHELSHITVRLYDMSEENFEQDLTDVTLKRLEGIEIILRDRVTALDERLNKLEGKLDERLNSFEALLKKLVGEGSS